MQTEIAPEIQQNPDWSRAVRSANDLLKAELGPSEPVVTTRWSLRKDISHRPVIALEIADPMVSISGQFAPKELTRNGNRLQLRLHRLWGNLLEERSAKHLQRLKLLVAQLDEGE